MRQAHEMLRMATLQERLSNLERELHSWRFRWWALLLLGLLLGIVGFFFFGFLAEGTSRNVPAWALGGMLLFPTAYWIIVAWVRNHLQKSRLSLRLELIQEGARPRQVEDHEVDADQGGIHRRASLAEPRSTVFVVHGHDEAALHETARFLETLGLPVAVLRELPDRGRTIIEKLVDHSDVGFAVVLLTPDDRGGSAEVSYDKQEARARQNVVLELGFFLGTLGRERVCVLYRKGVAIPSDYAGVIFVELDSSGGWKWALAGNLYAAGLPVDLNNVMKPSS